MLLVLYLINPLVAKSLSEEQKSTWNIYLMLTELKSYIKYEYNLMQENMIENEWMEQSDQFLFYIVIGHEVHDTLKRYNERHNKAFQ